MLSHGRNQRYPYSDNRCLKGKWSQFGKSMILDPNSVIEVVDLDNGYNAGRIREDQLLGLTEIIVALIPTRATANVYSVGESDAGSDSETLSIDENGYESLGHGHKKRRRCGSLEDDDEEEKASVATKPLTN